MKNILIPHKGLNELTLYSCFDDVTRYLDENKVSYRIDVQDNGECTVKYNWCKSQYNNVGLGQNNIVVFPTFLFCPNRFQ